MQKEDILERKDLPQEISSKIEDYLEKIRGTKLFGISYETFFTPISEVIKDDKIRSFFLSTHIRFVGELLLQDRATYVDRSLSIVRQKIVQLQKKKRISPCSLEEYALIRKEFGRLGVKQVFGKEIPECVATFLEITMESDNPLQISKNSYRRLFAIQKDQEREKVASLYRKLHLLAFWSYVLEKQKIGT